MLSRLGSAQVTEGHALREIPGQIFKIVQLSEPVVDESKQRSGSETPGHLHEAWPALQSIVLWEDVFMDAPTLSEEEILWNPHYHTALHSLAKLTQHYLHAAQPVLSGALWTFCNKYFTQSELFAALSWAGAMLSIDRQDADFLRMNATALTAMWETGMMAAEREFREHVLPVQGFVALGGMDVEEWCWVLAWLSGRARARA